VLSWPDSIFGIGYLEWLTGEIVKGVNSTSGSGEVTLLNAIIDPFVDKIIQV
jgi:sodium-dependent phosphate cotransporter